MLSTRDTKYHIYVLKLQTPRPICSRDHNSQHINMHKIQIDVPLVMLDAGKIMLRPAECMSGAECFELLLLLLSMCLFYHF